MRYYLIERQSGGCDYTIGCGIRVTEFVANDLEDAKKKVAKNIGSKWRGGDEHSIDSAELLEVSESCDLAAFLDQRALDRAKARKSKDQSKQLEKDKIEFARLQKKLGKS